MFSLMREILYIWGAKIMTLQIVVALPSRLQRKHLITFLTRNALADSISEVETREELASTLKIGLTTFVIVHQSLVADISLLPWGNFVFLVQEPDRESCLSAIACGARGYLLDKAPADLVARAIKLPPGQCMLSPAFTMWFAHLVKDQEISHYAHIVLTKREQEVWTLKKQHLTNREIANQLSISEKTVKKHVENMNRKLAEE